MSDIVVTLDVREHIHSGREPFSTIMQTVSRLKKDQKFLLIVPFEPVPLCGVMAQRGFDYAATPQDNGDWHVLFSPVAAMAPGPAEPPPCARSSMRVIEVDTARS